MTDELHTRHLIQMTEGEPPFLFTPAAFANIIVET